MTSLVFPGQGSQFVRMTKDFYDKFPIVRETFEVIETSTKINIKDIIFYNKTDLLNITQYAQLAIFCSSISIFNVLKKEVLNDKLSINYCLGHSLGEYSALVASKVLNIEDCSKLLKIRSELMQNSSIANISGMAAIIGLNCSIVEKIIYDNNLNVEVANDNSPFQVVISGLKKDLTIAQLIFKKNGARKFIHLNVSAAFHSKIMKKAEEKFKLFLNKIVFNEPIYPIISNFSAKESNDQKILLSNLSSQMSNKVRWVESINCLENLKETKIIEIGPGKVLSGLIKRISNNFTVNNINSIKDLENLSKVL